MTTECLSVDFEITTKDGKSYRIEADVEITEGARSRDSYEPNDTDELIITGGRVYLLGDDGEETETTINVNSFESAIRNEVY